ncbi:MAG TPA: MFS transporter [Acetobacteraceae bacterium]|nr:MFS transporter [Acetobacteraceae bacterium]
MSTTLRQQRHVVAACYLGWTLDAFDFFIMVFVLGNIAREFGTTVTTVTWAITLTLFMRALGAWIFGRIADRFGRRPTLIANVLCYSVLEFASGWAPDLAIFLILRGLYGIAMGGEWGVGASLTMESIPKSWRGPVSGLLQAGYPSGYLLASLLYWVAFPYVGWRGLFMLGAAPALLVLYIRRSVPESQSWQARQAAGPRPPILQVLRQHAVLAVYAVLMMTAFNFYSHGTQDLYPRFLQAQHHFDRNQVTAIAVAYNIAAILGGLSLGSLSQHFGRRRMIVTAALVSLPVIPLWAFATTAFWLGVGACLMQFCVQGAWGIIPAHLNELSPPDIRATFPGFTYQLGNLLASPNATIQAAIAASLAGDYRWPLAGVAGIVAVVIAVLVALGREARHIDMQHAEAVAHAHGSAVS